MRKGMPVEINGQFYKSMNDASIKLSIYQNTIKYRCLSKNFSDYKFTEFKSPEKLICSLCHEEKKLDEFKKDKNRKTGRNSWCKKCHSKYTTLNTDRKRANLNNKKYKHTTKGNFAGHLYKSLRRSREKINLSEKEKVDLIWYYAAAKFYRDAGINMSVDHIIPLSKGGLHHPSNLQLMLFRDNVKKNNKYELK